MERNENGTPVSPRSNGENNVLDQFFEGQNAQNGTGNGCRNRCGNNTGSESRGGCTNAQNGDTGMDISSDSLPLAYAYVPWQKWRLLYSPTEALANGTLFEELNKPLGVYGNE